MPTTLPTNRLRSTTGRLLVDDSGEMPYTHYAEIGETQVEMQEAVDQLRQAFDDPVLIADERFVEFTEYVKSFYPIRKPEEGGFGSSTKLEPAIPKFPIDIDDLERNPGPVRELLGNELTMYDLISFTHYLLTNTFIYGDKDPRLVWLEEIRGNQDTQD
jgi:hypothetical protein